MTNDIFRLSKPIINDDNIINYLKQFFIHKKTNHVLLEKLLPNDYYNFFY